MPLDFAMDTTTLLLLLLPAAAAAALLYPITLLFLHKQLLNNNNTNLPPTPFPALPFLGHIYFFFFFFNLPFHRALSHLSRRHGPLLFLRLGSRPALLVSSPSAARDCFTLNDVVFANRPSLLNGKHFGYNFTSLAWSPYGPHWRNLRRISALQLLSSHKLGEFSSIRAEEVRSMILKLLNSRINHNHIDLRKLFFEHTYNVVTGMIRGKARGGISEAEAFLGIVEEMSGVTLEANAVDFVPILGWLGFGGDAERKMRSVQEKRDRFMENMVDEWRRAGELEDDKQQKSLSLMRTLLEMQRAEPHTYTYTDETIRNLLLVLIQGASHAPSNTLEWAFARLLQNPHILSTARSHIDNLLGSHRLLTDSDLPKLPYLRHIINETLRMHPAAPLLTPHVSSDKCIVGGYYVPRGTMLLVNVWDIQNNPSLWKEPHKFMPERFAGAAMKSNEFNYGPFGWGRRACPGENLAMQMMGLALGSLIQCFEWEKVEGEQIDMREGKGVITSRAQPLRARCIPRPFVVDLLPS